MRKGRGGEGREKDMKEEEERGYRGGEPGKEGGRKKRGGKVGPQELTEITPLCKTAVSCHCHAAYISDVWLVRCDCGQRDSVHRMSHL